MKWDQVFDLYHISRDKILDAPVFQSDESNLIVFLEGIQHVELEESFLVHKAAVLGAVTAVSLGTLARHVHADIIQMLGTTWCWLYEIHTLFLKQ